MKYIFDFDDVLFNNTAQFKPHMFKTIVSAGQAFGLTLEQVEAEYKLVRQNQFSLRKFIASLFEGKELNQEDLYQKIMRPCGDFVDSNFRRLVERLGRDNVFIVTTGEDEFQKEKIAASKVGEWLKKDHIVTVRDKKSDAVKEIYTKFGNGEAVFFVDNDKTQFDGLDAVELPMLRTIHHENSNSPATLEKLNIAMMREMNVATIRRQKGLGTWKK